MNWSAIIKGACVAVLLFALGKDVTEWQWWIAMLALNIALNA